MKNSAFCKELNEQRCPCYLALLNECTYCTLLQGENLCNCNWSGDCALHYFPWENVKISNYDDCTLIAAIFHPYACGLIIKKCNQTNLSIGTKLTLYYPKLKQAVNAVILSVYPEHKLIYAISFDAFPFRMLEKEKLDIYEDKNVFSGAFLLNESRKNLLIICEKSLHNAIAPLINFLIQNKNNVTLQDTEFNDSVIAYDIIIFIGKESRLRHTVQNLHDVNTKIAVWIT